MTFWQENYPFIKDVYLMRQTKMVEWMENVEKSISRIMADKVYTSAEFKRERDNFHVSHYHPMPIRNPESCHCYVTAILGPLQRLGAC